VDRLADRHLPRRKLLRQGLAELVTATLADYEVLALRLANDRSALKAVRDRLDQNRSHFPLFDTDRFRRHIESAYTTMWETHQRGEPPRSFRVDPIPGAPRPATPRQRPLPQNLLAPDHAAVQPASAAANDQAVRLLLVCGPWGSGTTAVAGLLHRLGVTGLEPYFATRDERTSNSYESTLFRDVMVGLADEESLNLRPGAEATIESALRKFRDRVAAGAADAAVKARQPIFLKHPLAALFLPQICKLFDARLVYAVRPLAEIEATRRRRNWAPQFGAKGADVIYAHMFKTFVDHAFPTTIVRYKEIARRPGAACPHAVRICRPARERDSD